MGHPHHFKPASLEPADVTSFFLTTSSEPAGNGANNSGNTLNYQPPGNAFCSVVRRELPWMQEASLRVNALPV